jgi:peptidoglycan DL-endopeptidase CwlO
VRGVGNGLAPRSLATAGVLVFALLGAAGGRADPSTSLRQRAADLESQEHAAVLALYSIDSRLDSARADLSTIRGRLAALRTQQATARAELKVARRTLTVAQRRLGRTLVALYESPENDPLAVILGATSFNEAIDGLDNLSRIADAHASVATQARRARQRITALSRSLRTRAAETSRLVAAGAAKEAELERVRGERASYVVGLRRESAQVADRIAVVEAEARAAQARAATVAQEARAAGSVGALTAAPQPVASPPPPPVSEQPPAAAAAPIEAPPSGSHTLTVTVTAYSGGGTTATGIPVGFGVVAVDPTVIPLGTRMTIPGYGEGVAADTGPGVKGAWIDVWLPTEAQAEAWGTKTLTITIH